MFGLLTVKPENITAVMGQTITMSCNTTLQEAVDWRRKVLSAERFEIFCFRGDITQGYKDKFSISNPYKGFYVVTMKNVQLDDSGEYRCIEGVDKDPNYGTVVLTVNGNYSHFLLVTEWHLKKWNMSFSLFIPCSSHTCGKLM